jgi:hypothetical protein
LRGDTAGDQAAVAADTADTECHRCRGDPALRFLARDRVDINHVHIDDGGHVGHGSDGRLITGGITTQLTGPVPGRARLAVGRAPRGVLTSPTRYMRVAARSLCDPGNINGLAAPLGGVASFTGASLSVATPLVPCLDRAVAANGLRTGQYLAPVTDFLFPENVRLGDRIVPNNFWALGFLSAGEGQGTGPLIPPPW